MQSTMAVDGDFLRNVTRMAWQRALEALANKSRKLPGLRVASSAYLWPEPAGEVVEGKWIQKLPHGR